MFLNIFGNALDKFAVLCYNKHIRSYCTKQIKHSVKCMAYNTKVVAYYHMGYMKRKHYILLTIISLTTGTLVYVFYNQSTFVFTAVSKVIHIPKMNIENPILAGFLQCYCADLFWAFSFALIIQSILMLDRKKAYWLMLSSCLGLVVEILQMFHIIKGVFDFYDIIVYIIGTGITTIIVRLGGNHYESKTK